MITITVQHDPSWRSPHWENHLPSRPSWFVSCPEHPKLGTDRDGMKWGYSPRHRAMGVVTTHVRAKHPDGHMILHIPAGAS